MIDIDLIFYLKKLKIYLQFMKKEKTIDITYLFSR